MDYEGAVIPKGDERLRTFPFPTRRPVCLPFNCAVLSESLTMGITDTVGALALLA